MMTHGNILSLLSLQLWAHHLTFISSMALLQQQQKQQLTASPECSTDFATMTPCELPVRRKRKADFDKKCGRAYFDLDYVCDLTRNKYFGATHATVLNRSLTEHISHLYDNVTNEYRVGVAVFGRVESPSSMSFYEDQDYKCFGSMSLDRIGMLTESFGLYMDSFARVLHKRWFQSYDGKPCKLNVLILVLECGRNGPGVQLPFIKVHTGTQCPQRGSGLAAKLEKLAEKSLENGNHLANVIADLFGPLNKELATNWDSGHAPNQGIPPWAARSFLACFVLVAIAMFLEYLIVRRNTGIKRSAASGALSAAATGTAPSAKTHMMF